MHWSTAVLLVVAAASIYARTFIGDRTVAALLLAVHETSGVAVLLLTAARLAWRIRARVGAVNANLPRMLRVLAGAGHLALYAVLFTLTTLGWLTADAFGGGVRLFGVLPLPHLIAHDRDLGDDLQQWHAGAAWLLLALVIAHIAAALLHHFVRRDDVLRSMQPFTSRLRPQSIARLRTLLHQRRRINTAAASELRRVGAR
jgi:cytochrome b561